MIDWLNRSCKITEYFTVEEAIWLPSWNRLATPLDGLDHVVKDSLCALFIKMDKVREYLGVPIIVHVAYRPKSYNEFVRGAKNSAHILGRAVDWSCSIDCDAVREKLLPKLEGLGMRMENKPKSNWVHLDTMPVKEGGNRFFRP